MDFMNIFSRGTPEVVGQSELVFWPVDFMWENITSLTWLQAIITVSFGAVYLIYGWRIFKILVVISFGLLGMFLGMWLGTKAGSEIWGGVVGLVLAAVVSIPLMRWAVCALGAVAGGILTGGVWYAFGLSEHYILAGVLIGILGGGMISFIVFKNSVMLFTSLGGSALIVTGVLALWHLYLVGDDNYYVRELVFNYKWFLPVAFLVPTVAGILLQNRFIKDSHKWEL